MTLSPAHTLILEWLAAHPGQSTDDIARALGEPGDEREVARLCSELADGGFIAAFEDVA